MERAAKNSSVDKNLNFFPKFYKNIINKTKKQINKKKQHNKTHKDEDEDRDRDRRHKKHSYTNEKNARKRRDHVVLFKLTQRLAKTSS